MIKTPKETTNLCNSCRNTSYTKIRIRTYPYKCKEIYLCKDCMNALSLELAKRIVPKSPDNMLNKKRIKKVDTNE